MKIEITITLSKILAFLILLISIPGAYYFNDSTVLIRGFEFSGIVMGIKAGASEWQKYRYHRRNMEKPPPNEGENLNTHEG